jgi:tetratricopeptide (TPR) repeat protein
MTGVLIPVLTLGAGLVIVAAGCAPGAASPARLAPQPNATAQSEAKRQPETPQQSIAELTAEIAAHPDDPSLYATRASCYVLLHDQAAADRDYARAIEIESRLVDRYPANPNTWLARAQIYADWGKYDSAISDLNHAIDLEPQAAAYRLWRASVYVRAGDMQKALADCNDAVEMQPGNALVWSDRGWAFVMLGENQKAIADFNRAIELDPSASISFARRGFAYGAVGNYAQARADFEQAIRLDGNNPVGYGALAWLLATAHKPQLRNGGRAIANAKHAMTLPDGNASWILAALAAGQAEAGDFKDAVKTQERAIAETPARDTALAKQQHELLADYQARKPFHGSFAELEPVTRYIYARD